MVFEISRSAAGYAGKLLSMAVAIGLLQAAPTAAQPATPQPVLVPPQAHPTEDDAVPETETAKLNAEQNKFASSQLEENEEAQRAHDAEAKAREEKIAQEQAAYEAAKEKRERDYAEAMAKWKADVEACKAGDKSKCAAE